MTPMSNESSATPPRRVGRRARRRQVLIGAAVAGLVAVTAVVVVAAVTGGSRSGTLVNGTGIDSFDPTSGIVNDEVHIVGAGFTGATEVRFGDVPATSFNVISDTELVTLVPDGAITGPISVSTPDEVLTSDDDFHPGAPVIDSFTPTSAAAGTLVTITGHNLGGATAVRFNGKEVSASRQGDGQVQAIVPANASTGLVTVVTDSTNGTSQNALTITSPSIADISPHAGAPGTNVTITGANLSGSPAVTFNGTPATVVSAAADGTSLVVTAPPNLKPGKISVIAGGQTATSDDSFGTGPVISSFAPTAGPPGTTVTITGKNFTNAVLVSFSGTSGASSSFTITSDTQITAVVPDDASTGPVTISTGGVTTSTASFTVTADVDSFSPDQGVAGSVVNIYGTGLSGVTAVKFGTVAASLPKVSSTQITVTVPSGATTGPITLVLGSTTLTTTDTFTVGALAAVTPSYDRLAPAPAPWTPPTGLPAGGTDFSKQTKVTLAGLVVTGLVAQTTTTSTTAAATTTTTATTLKATTTTAAPSTTATGTTAPATTVAGATSSAPATTAAATTTTVPQTPYNSTGTVSIGGSGSFTAKITYTDPLNWSITPNTTSQSVTISVGGQPMTVSALTGSVTSVAGTTTWTLQGTGSATTLITNKFALRAGATVSFSFTCPSLGSAEMCASGSGPFARIDADAGTSSNPKGLSAVVGNIVPNQTSMAYQAVVDLVDGSLNLDATYPAGTLATIRDGRLRIAYKDKKFAATDADVNIESGSVNKGLDIIVTGKSHVDVPFIGGFNPPSITVWYLDGGSMLSFRFPMKRAIHEASFGSATFVTGHGSPVQATLVGEPRQLTDGAWVFVGSMRMPSYMQKSFGTKEGEVAAVATMTTNGIFELKAMFRTPIELPKIPYVETSFEGFEFGIRTNESNPDVKLEIFAGASGTISIDGKAPASVALELALTFGKEPTWSIALTASGTEGRALWPDVLGVKDFDLDKFSIEATFIMFTVEPVGVGLAGSGTLPTKLLEYMGMSGGATQPASFVVNLSADEPCLQVTAGTPDNTSPLFSFPPESGAININYFRISASVVGCMVGVFDVPAGVLIAEKGDFLGVKKDYLLAFNPKPTGLRTKTPSFYGWDITSTSANKGAIKLSYKLTWGAGGWNPLPYFYLDGQIKLGNNNQIQVHGGCAIVVDLPNCYLKGAGVIDLGLGLSASMAIDAEGVGTPVMSVAAAGDINIFGLKFGLTGSFTSAAGAPLGFDFSATADLPGKSSLLDKLSVRVGYGLRNFVSVCLKNGVATPCTKWLQDPLFALTIEGNTGGLMKFINGAADAFGAPPVPNGGRYKLRAAWDGSLNRIKFGGSTSIYLGALGTVKPSVFFDLCLEKSCFGDVDASFGFDYKKGGKTWSFDDIPLGDDWGFNYSTSYSDSFYESGKTGDSWGGLKGTISGSIAVTLKISYPPVSAGLDLDFDLRAKGYLGLGGDWNYLGTYGVSYSSSSDEFCFGAKGYKICV